MDLISQITSSDLFSRLTKALLVAEQKDFQTIDDSGGDAGNDGYSESQQSLFQFYCPEKPEKADDSVYKSKIKEDLDKAKKLIDSGKYKITDWIFVTPRELRESVQTYLRTEAKARGMNGIAWASPKLIELFAKHNHLRSQFPDLIQPDIEEKIGAIVGHLESVDDIKKQNLTKLEKSYQRKIDQAKQKVDQQKYETAQKEYALILSELEAETEKIDPHIYFRVFNNLGICEQKLGNTERAADLFERAYLAEPNLPLAVCQHALSKILKNVPAEGLPIIEALLEKHPTNDYAITTKANILQTLGRYSDLLPFLRKEGKITLVHWYEGFEKMSKKDYEGATTCFENVARLEPKNVGALMLVAQNIMIGTQEFVKNNPFPPDKIPEKIKQKFTKAIDSLKEAIRLLNEAEQKENLEMAYTNLSGCYVAVGMCEESIAAAEEAASIYPNAPTSFLNKGIAQLKLNRYQDAIKSFQTHKDLGGESIDVERHIAFCALKIGDTATAEKIISTLLESTPELDFSVAELAIDLYSRKLDSEKLNLILEKLEKEFPDNSQALRLRGTYMQRLGLAGSEALLQRAFENATSESEKIIAEIYIADMKYDKKDYLGAAEIYKKYLNIQEANPTTFQYAQCLYESGQYGALLDWVETLAESIRNQVSIKRIEAYANFYLDNLGKASQLFKDLFEKNPNEFRYIVYYGMCRFRLSKEADAKVAFDAIKNRVSETQDLTILAGGYEFIGEWKTAIELTFKALENDPNNPKAHLAFIFAFLRREQITGEEPEEKHIKAFQKSIGEFNKRFPEEKALQGFEVKDGDISQILKVADQIAEITDNATKLYNESQAPMAAIPRMTGKKPFDIWAAFTQMPEVGVKISFGTPDEIVSETETIEAHKDRSVVVDIYPLFLLSHFDQLDLLLKMFKKIYIHQSIMDELIAIIEDRRMSLRNGASVFGKINGRHQMIEIPAGQVKKTLDLIEKIRKFVSSNPEVQVSGFLKEKPKSKRDTTNALDRGTRDSILLAQDLGVALYCDDRILRAVVNQEHKIKSFSSQTLFIVAHKNNLISLDKRYELQRGMIDFNYEFISMDGVFIFNQLKVANYDVEKIKTIISHLVRKETNIQSLGTVLSDLFLLLMLEKSITGKIRIQVFRYILKEATPNHDLLIIEESIFANLQNRVPPQNKEKLKSLIRLFFNNHS